MRVSLLKSRFLGTATLSVLISLGILASFGFQQGGPGGVGQPVNDYVWVAQNPPAQAGDCYNFDPTTGIYTQRQFVQQFGGCDGGVTCSPVSTCYDVSSAGFSENTLIPTNCRYAKTVTHVLVGQSCGEPTNAHCPYCPTLLVCHVYKLYEQKSGVTCTNPCGAFLLKFGGHCVYNGTP